MAGLPSVTATIKARLRVWPVLLLRHLCMMMALKQRKPEGLFAIGGLVDSSHILNILCLFLLSFSMSSLLP